jgi:UDP-N-acetylglucosamine 2-epimerase (non-hydrolysing)
MRTILVAGARPNFMKIAPVLWALEARDIEVLLLHSGQHYDAAMSDVFFEDLGIRPPDMNLDVGSGSHAAQTARIMERFEQVVDDYQPDVVLVPGDVNSTVACGLVAAKAGAHLAHIEAGLRSRDWGMPEEINRVVTDRLSDFLLAPSADAAENLRSEGYREDQIHLVGNVMVDTLLTNLDRARNGLTLRDLGVVEDGYGLVTMHRPSNVDDPDVLKGLVGALNKVSEEVPLVFPIHPRTRQRIDLDSLASGITLAEPAGYLDFVALQAGARLVLTDSGGVQEETTMLGVPCLTMRENTERPITVEEGSNRVVGTDPATIVAAARDVLGTRIVYPKPDLWDGKASERIVDALVETPLDQRPRPTDLW